jgi:hypothetical protein
VLEKFAAIRAGGIAVIGEMARTGLSDARPVFESKGLPSFVFKGKFLRDL